MIHVVLGAFFGDEGKGQTVHELCMKNDSPLVVRFSGGHQVGHTVIYKDKTHIFSNFGSGSLLEVPTYWTSYCTVDPLACIKEKRILEELGITPSIIYDALCPVVIPHDIIYQMANEKNRKDGTVGTGFGTCLNRCKSGFPLFAAECTNIDVLRSKVYSIVDNYYLPLLRDKTPVDKNKLDNWIWSTFCYFVNAQIVGINTYSPLPCYDNVIFEGSQGILLDQRFGVMPHCTPSNVTSQNVWELISSGSWGDVNIHYVCRPYITRHGNGPTITNATTSNFINDSETNSYNEFQGGLRQVGMDVRLLEHSILMDRITHKGIPRRILEVRQCKLTTPELRAKFQSLLTNKTVHEINYRDLE